ncbi:hypothetical protein Hanom_Chr09g00844291 [Helianthus anomalus]
MVEPAELPVQIQYLNRIHLFYNYRNWIQICIYTYICIYYLLQFPVQRLRFRRRRYCYCYRTECNR